MKFGFDEIILWSHHNQIRRIHFARNKVNLVTGKSGMGKTSIMKIIDYCLLASKHQIPHSIINENVSWYGIKFYINSNQFIIARKSPIGENVSKDYFFLIPIPFLNYLKITSIVMNLEKLSIMNFQLQNIQH